MKSNESCSDYIFISWIKYHGRSEGISRALSIPNHFISGGDGNILRRYVLQWKQTRQLLDAANPRGVIVMQPPVVALLAIRTSKQGRKLRIAADLHTGAFTDPKWAWSLPLVVRLLGKHGVSLVTNQSLASEIVRRGASAIVLHDLIEVVEPRQSSPANDAPYILVPLAYAHDEPLRELLEAARLAPEIKWRLTGSAPKWISEVAPENVRLLGYLSNNEYWNQFDGATAIAALTTEENTMQRAGYEAMSRGKALLTTDRRVLRDYFGDAAIYAEPTPDSLAAMARVVVSTASTLRSKMSARRDVQISAQKSGIQLVASWLAL